MNHDSHDDLAALFAAAPAHADDHELAAAILRRVELEAARRRSVLAAAGVSGAALAGLLLLASGALPAIASLAGQWTGRLAPLRSALRGFGESAGADLASLAGQEFIGPAALGIGLVAALGAIVLGARSGLRQG